MTPLVKTANKSLRTNEDAHLHQLFLEEIIDKPDIVKSMFADRYALHKACLVANHADKVSKSHILIIDDDEVLLQLLEELLTAEGYCVTAVPGATNIAQLLRHCKPDLLIIDYKLKESSGGALCHEVRNDGLYKHLPILLLSAWPQAAIVCHAGDYNIFIPKPFDLWVFLACVGELVP